MTRLVALLGLILVPFYPASAAPIRVAGSDLLAESVGAELTRFASANDLEVATAMKGSRLGLEALKTDAADFALLVFSDADEKPGPEFSSSVVGYMTAVLVVPSDLPLTQIHYAQLAGIFGASEVNNYKRWNEIGLSGAWGVRGITTVATTRRAGLSLDLFRLAVMQTPEFKPTVQMFDEPAKALERIGGEEGGIALLPAPPADGAKLKVLLVAKTERDVAYGPTPENLHTGDYPLRLPVHLVLRKGSARKLNFVLRHLLSDEAAPALLKSGVVPLPVQARNQLVFDLENL
jgi:hypothetical protein